jgi:hypothetical protein
MLFLILFPILTGIIISALNSEIKCKLLYIKSNLLLIYKNIHLFLIDGLVWFMVPFATFNNISVITWQSVLLVEETRGPGENH